MTRRPASRRAQGGFSLIEVLIALLVLALGLLGLAFLQVLNVRYTSSAEHRTMATNLASEVVDMMRSNPRHLVVYNRLDKASFANVAVPATGCSKAGDSEATAQNNVARWRCDVVTQLPGGVGNVVVAGNDAVGYTATVDLEWTDDVGAKDNADAVRGKTASFRVVTTL
ncbi:type IV pilus modification protein PilV [Lysobacter auxotrophicus]|uniref:Type IV pilus modification protein PilV n=1 Tax=Lysobacter auxotrophicus TaxID=2992573 RepID=A0ABM8DG41_9GAMM|nr:type IV pilus modification protein PilV [Lysobacter auxotrophicus]BDU17574.1 type IV pilus modification protein PilV [Lysobacter auxotrophicus]